MTIAGTEQALQGTRLSQNRGLLLTLSGHSLGSEGTACSNSCGLTHPFSILNCKFKKKLHFLKILFLLVLFHIARIHVCLSMHLYMWTPCLNIPEESIRSSGPVVKVTFVSTPTWNKTPASTLTVKPSLQH